MKMFKLLTLIFCFFSLFLLAGCAESKIVLLPVMSDDDSCPVGAYCHTFNVDGGTVYLNFSSVNGTLWYEVDS